MARDADATRLRNAKLILEVSCLGRPGESVLIAMQKKFSVYAEALVQAAEELRMMPALMDLTAYVNGEAYEQGRVLPPLKAAMEAADIVILAAGGKFGELVGDPDMSDIALTAQRRWMHLQNNGMEQWDIAREEVAAIRTRAEWLIGVLGRSSAVRVTSAAGTDFSFGLGEGSKYLPILGIIPLYGEVAVTPRQGSESGVYVVDGPTQMGVRTKDELGRAPLRITVEAGRVKDVSGDDEQVRRCKEFIASGDPPADRIDEVGILTTKLVENDEYWWTDGTHHHDCVHIALGNNVRRDTLVHGPRHMDGEVHRPTIEVDGTVVVEEGVFRDELVS